jgi:hypothetical protein
VGREVLGLGHQQRQSEFADEPAGLPEVVRVVVRDDELFERRPDERGHFGDFGGRYVAETLMPLILDLEQAYKRAKADPAFQAEMDDWLLSTMSAGPARSISPSG